MKRWFLVAVAVGAGLLGGCSVAAEEEEDESGELGTSPDEIREVVPGPLVKSTDGEVWSVENAWADTNTANARKAGIAWEENSGLSWEEKYAKWVSSFEQVDGRSYGKTIRLKTPYGRTLDGPVLECADVAIWLRMTFASWYHLPFYMEGWVGGQPVYFGHFGVVDKNGNPVSNYPRFRTQYADYESRWRPGQPWPKDSRLRGRHIGSDDGASGVLVDGTPLEEGAGAGAYFDELFLNKRAGYLMILLDANFGSMNLADGANMFHIQPEATTPGDALVKRYQKTGIGHVLPVITVETTLTGKMRASVASGSMPRRQPYWEPPSQSASYFWAHGTGGPGESHDGTPYAKLGGGIRRWRTPVATGGRWNNIVPLSDRDVYIEDRNLEAIAARPEKFKELMAEESPEARRDAALDAINRARNDLRQKPASCSTRQRREDAFAALYEVMETSFGKSKAEVDAEYRTLEDHVFTNLVYQQSKTCCWNTTTPAMAEIILDYAQKEAEKDASEGVCREPKVFKASEGGKYDTWKAHAASLGRAADWREWSADESCPQSGVFEDTVVADAPAMCQ